MLLITFFIVCIKVENVSWSRGYLQLHNVCWVRGGGGTVRCGYNGYPVTVRFLTDGYPVTKYPTPSTPSSNRLELDLISLLVNFLAPLCHLAAELFKCRLVRRRRRRRRRRRQL